MEEKNYYLAEGETTSQDGQRYLIRVCEKCLAEGNLEARLERHVQALEAYTAVVRELHGRLRVPSRAEWRAAEDARDAEIVGEAGALPEWLTKLPIGYDELDDPPF